MSQEGAVDDYLTESEQEYFNSGGVKVADELTEEVNEQDNKPETGLEGEASDAASADGEHEGTSEESTTEESSAIDELPTENGETGENDEVKPHKKRDLEKAFKAEHHKRKQQAEAYEKRTKELESRLEQVQAQMAEYSKPKAPEPPPEVIPDIDVDPIGYQQYKINKLESAITAHQQYLQNQYEQSKKSQSEAAFMQHYRGQADSFAKQTPDFMDAYNFLMSGRIEEHMEAGFSEEQAKQLIVEDEIAIASLALQQKVNPAERLYNIAKKRGYNAKAKGGKASGKTIESLQNGLNNSKSLKSGGGEPPDREAGLDEIDGMSFEEFDSHFNKLKAKQKGMR